LSLHVLLRDFPQKDHRGRVDYRGALKEYSCGGGQIAARQRVRAGCTRLH
jgi:hypothetical protein